MVLRAAEVVMRRLRPAALAWLAGAAAALSLGVAALPLPERFAGESGLPAAETPQQQGQMTARASIKPILAMAPFGRARQMATSSGDAAETTLGLTLHGVVIASASEASSAIVSGGVEPAQIYFIGDAVTDAALLDAVFSDHVILSLEGRVETLSFPEAHARRAASGRTGVGADLVEPPADVNEVSEKIADEEEGLAAEGLSALRAFLASARGEEAQASDTFTAEPEAAKAKAPDSSPTVGAPEGEATSEDLADLFNSLRLRFSEEPADVLKEYGLTATPTGYSVGGERANALLRVGFEPGDLISTVNGRKVGDTAADAAIVDEAFASGRVRVEFQRDGQTLRLTYPLW